MAISTAITPSAVARGLGIKTEFKDLRAGQILFLPQRIAILGQGSAGVVYSTDPRTVTNASEVGSRYGYGSPLHTAALELFPVTGNGVGTIPVTVYPLAENPAGVEATGAITPPAVATLSASYRIKVGKLESALFVIEEDDTAADMAATITAAINATLELPVTAAVNGNAVDLTSKWAGSSANSIKVTLEPEADIEGDAFTVTALAGGLANPDVVAALAALGSTWETLLINCQEMSDEAALDAIQTQGEARYGAEIRRPFFAFTGHTLSSQDDDDTDLADARPTDRINSQVLLRNGADLPWVIAASAAAQVALLANENPPHDYGGRVLSGVIPSDELNTQTYTVRDATVKAGSSTLELRDGEVTLSDVVTMYKPVGEAVPAYRYVVDIVKIQTILYNLDLIFDSAKWRGAPLIPNDQPTVNPDARRPSDAVADVAAMIDSLEANALISDGATAKANTFAEIDAQNPKRLNVATTLQIVGNSNVLSVDFNFGFFFGGA